MNDRREELAALAHAQWSGWMEYLFSKCRLYGQTTRGMEYIVPGDLAERWQRQMHTAYADLPEDEKESDRAEADRVLALFEDHP